jgi:hypothetical protein
MEVKLTNADLDGVCIFDTMSSYLIDPAYLLMSPYVCICVA